MRKPFILAIQTERKLTDLQSLRRGRLIEKSKCYRDYLARLRRTAKQRADRLPVHPIKGGLMFRPSPLADDEVWSIVETIERLDAGMCKPHEQLMLEIEVWQRAKG